MIRSTIARVDLNALKRNFIAVQRYLASESGRTAPAIIGVVKANAYGHRAPRVALALEDAGATMLACADIEEGIGAPAGRCACADTRVRRAQRQRSGRALRLRADAHDLYPWGRARGAGRRRTSARDHRLPPEDRHRDEPAWVSPRQSATHASELLASANLQLDAVYTHFASADVPESPVFNDQRERFEDSWRIVQELAARPEARSPQPAARLFRHASNSAALLRDSRVWYDAVRPDSFSTGSCRHHWRRRSISRR